MNPHHPSPRNSRGSGFTLVELLVVVAILIILASLLLPVLAKGIATARKTECLVRHQKWGNGLISYSLDNLGLLPREGFHNDGNTHENNWGHVEHAQSLDVWYNVLSNEVGRLPAAAYAWPPDKRLDFYRKQSGFQCASAPFPDGVDNPRFGEALFSIAMNSQLITAQHKPTTLFNRIHKPSRTVLFAENLLKDDRRVTEFQARNEFGQPATRGNRFAGLRHGRTGNIGFADGHAESVLGARVVETQGPNRGWEILPPVNIYWDPDYP